MNNGTLKMIKEKKIKSLSKFEALHFKVHKGLSLKSLHEIITTLFLNAS